MKRRKFLGSNENEPAQVVPARAYLFMALSLAAMFLWPLRPEIFAPYITLTPVVWFFSIGMMALSLARFYGVRHAVPAPELYIFLYALSLYFFVNHLPYKIRSLDEYLLSFDYSFGYLELAIGKMFRQSSLVGFILGLTYNTLMLAVALLYLALPGVATRRRFVAAVVLAGITILPMYALCPGAGPKYLLGDRFPWWVPDLSQPRANIAMPVMNAVTGGMNAIPSGHFAWALLIFWFARKYCGRAVQIATGIFMTLTCLATLGTGEHYIVDLVLSVPFAAGIWALVYRQWRFAGISIAVVLIWLVAIREGWALTIPPVLVWLLTGMTVAPFLIHGRVIPAHGTTGLVAVGEEIGKEPAPQPAV